MCRSYEEIHQEAIAGVLAGLDAGVSRLEVEFPPIAQTNKVSSTSVEAGVVQHFGGRGAGAHMIACGESKCSRE
jgi:hypothetical protein